MENIIEKLKNFKQIKEKLKEIEESMRAVEWDFCCDTCMNRTVRFHGLDLYPNELRFYCESCGSAAELSEDSRRSVEKYIMNRLGIQWPLNLEFRVNNTHVQPTN